MYTSCTIWQTYNKECFLQRSNLPETEVTKELRRKDSLMSKLITQSKSYYEDSESCRSLYMCYVLQRKTHYVLQTEMSYILQTEISYILQTEISYIL